MTDHWVYQRRWAYTLDIKDLWAKSVAKGGTLPTDDLGKQIAARIRGKFRRETDITSDHYDRDLDEIVELLENVSGYDDVSLEDDFDNAWESFYNWADANRVWVKII